MNAGGKRLCRVAGCDGVGGSPAGDAHRAVYAHKPVRKAAAASLPIASAAQETAIIAEMTARRLIAHAARYVFDCFQAIVAARVSCGDER
jgi:hypothetical protein